MASIKLKTNPTAIHRRAKEYAINVRGKLQQSAPSIVAAITSDILSRTPSPEQEENLINFGQEGQGSLPVTNVRQSSNNKNRQNFIRTPGMWLQQAVVSQQANYISPKGFSIRIGNLAMLNEITKFSWQNASKNGVAELHTTKYGMFSMFEFGTNVLGMGHVKPAFGTNYFLTPAEYTRIPEMTKTIPPFGMYTHLNPMLITALIKEKIREVNF